jgi:post-segregation antitoxin (ccd killing protein)
MPKVTVYLPDDLYQQARERGLPVSTLAQQALEQAIARDRATAWVTAVESRPPRVKRRLDTSTLMDQVRDEFDE